MGKQYQKLDPKLRDFISKQHIFFTASATITSRVNVSPRSTDCLKILDDNTIIYLDKTDANKALVQNFFGDVLMGGQFDKVSNYISPEQYDQHAPGMEDGIAGLVKHVQELLATVGTAKYLKLHRLIGQGNFVVAFSHVQKAQSHFAVLDIFRIKDGRMVEHWDVQEKILAPEEWNNSGKF